MPSQAFDFTSASVQMTEVEFQREVQRACRDSRQQTSEGLRKEPDVAMLRGPIPNAPESTLPALFARDLFFDELDKWRHAGCPRYEECLDAAERALRYKSRLDKRAQDAKTFVCATSCSWRKRQRERERPDFTPELIRFLESDSKMPLFR